MSTYQDLVAKRDELTRQAAELEKQLQEARRAERAGVIAQIKSLMAEHELTVADLGGKTGKANGTSSTAGRKVAPKYRNASTGDAPCRLTPSSTAAISSPPKPSVVPVPTTPGPWATITTCAPLATATWTPDSVLTAS